MFVSRHDLATDIAGQSMAVWAGHLVALNRGQIDIFAAVSTNILEQIRLAYTRVLYKCWNGAEHCQIVVYRENKPSKEAHLCGILGSSS